MARFFLFVFVVGGTALAAFLTRPEQPDFQRELQKRYAAIAPASDAAPTDAALRMRMHSDNLLDQMVATTPPGQLIQQTTYRDFFVLTVFTTTYQSPMGRERLRTFGIFGSLIPFELE
ncbi:MAG: hypothetical protein GVY18_01405 [Bacteroidetes bacterium]|jgi:hypothetical protein|nr:hypothetical protein [Bacteroidota bacterium]